jgi:hypothetical protein
MLGVATEEMPVSDLANWDVHGPVHTLRTEFAEWNLSLERWQAARHFTLVRFDPDGKITESESHNPDGSVSRSSYAYDAGRLQEARFGMNGDPTGNNIYFYDECGRLTRVVSVDRNDAERESEAYSYSQDGNRTKVYFVPKLEPDAGFVYGIEGTAQSYDAAGATTITTRYQDRAQPDEVVFYSADQRVLRRVIFTRDGTGRLMKEEMHLGEQTLFPDIEKELENVSPGARSAAVAAIADLVVAKNVMSSTTYAYDGKSRLLERRMRLGELGDHRTTFRYDDFDNLIEETSEHTSREVQVDEEGNLHTTKENSDTQNVRFEYRYDAQGNWTERVACSRLQPNPSFERSNIVRREITYYAG